LLGGLYDIVILLLRNAEVQKTFDSNGVFAIADDKIRMVRSHSLVKLCAMLMPIIYDKKRYGNEFSDHVSLSIPFGGEYIGYQTLQLGLPKIYVGAIAQVPKIICITFQIDELGNNNTNKHNDLFNWGPSVRVMSVSGGDFDQIQFWGYDRLQILKKMLGNKHSRYKQRNSNNWSTAPPSRKAQRIPKIQTQNRPKQKWGKSKMRSFRN
jgi:hypothetical protein